MVIVAVGMREKVGFETGNSTKCLQSEMCVDILAWTDVKFLHNCSPVNP